MSISSIASYKRWDDALKLLSAQLDLFVNKNYRHFNTLSFIYYAEVRGSAAALADVQYHSEKVATGLFYGLRNEFSIYSYSKPKPAFGLRDNRFLSYPMRVLVYAVGLYIVKLTQEFLDGYYRRRKSIQSFYGADLRYKKDELLLAPKRLVFYDDYKRFRRLLKKEVRIIPERLVLKVDIQNYFDNISIPRMLQLISNFVKQSEQQRLGFSVDTQSELRTFFEFVSRGRPGIPQSDNDPISSFLGHLFLVFGDLLIDDEIARRHSLLQAHRVIRYMDDIYVVLDFKPGQQRAQQRLFVMSLLEKIADDFHLQLGLKLNDKTRLYWLDTQEEVDHLLESLKKISPRPISASTQGEQQTPAELEEAVEDLFEALVQLAQDTPSDIGKAEAPCNHEAFKEIYDKRISNLLDKQENVNRLTMLMSQLNWELMKLAPQELTILLLKCPDLQADYLQFLNNKDALTTRDIELITTLLCHEPAAQTAIINKLKADPIMSQIAETITATQIIPPDPGYFGLGAMQLQRVSTLQVVIEQIKLRVLNEDLERYSVALNHLVNEFQSICRSLPSTPQGKEFDANATVQFLQEQHISHELCIKIRNLFDRRNLNQVSHAAGEDDQPSWGVSSKEYAEYKEAVGRCLRSTL
jgi:AbiA family abortive infection protein